MHARVIDQGRRRKLFVRFGGVAEGKQEVLPSLSGRCNAVGRCGPGAFACREFVTR